MVAFKWIAYVSFLVLGCHGHTYHSGECPSVEPMSSFDMHQVSFIYNTLFVHTPHIIIHEFYKEHNDTIMLLKRNRNKT